MQSGGTFRGTSVLMWANFEAAEELTIRKQLWTLSKRMGVGMTKFICQVPIIFSTCGLVDTVQEGYTGFHMGAFNVEISDYLNVTILLVIVSAGYHLSLARCFGT
ncbi:Granule-bound starch synthase 1, chloroplastic/amyloplastic [Glycine soja]|nr:Granule-bound starch synthase 1, chloroplastic/amyloplastic [Glycine max]